MTAPQSNSNAAARFGANIGAGLSKRLERNKMTPYQKAEIERKEKAEERRIAIENIANIDAHAALLVKQGEPEAAQALLQSNAPLIKKWQGWRVSANNKILSTNDAIVLTTQQIKDETALIQAQQGLGYTQRTGELTGDPIAATKQLEKSIDRVAWVGTMAEQGIVPEANTVFGASLQVATQAKLDVDKALAKFPRDPETGEVMGTKEQKTEVEGLENIQKEFTTQIQGIVQTAPANVVKQVKDILTSEIEKGGGVAEPPPKVVPPPEVKPPLSGFDKFLVEPTAEKAGAGIRKYLSGGLSPSMYQKGFTDLGDMLRQTITGASSAVGGAFGVGRAPSVEEQDKWLADLLYKALYKKGAETPSGYDRREPKPTAISEELFNKSSLRR